MSEHPSNSADVFPTTNWSVVLSVREGGETGRLALDALCRKYWRPVRAFFTLNGVVEDETEDLAQEYFSSLLAREYLHEADRERGRFRAFLVQDLKFFLWDALAKKRAKKRGGNTAFVPLDSSVEPMDPASAQTAIFDRQWALQIVENARELLRAEFEAEGRGELFRLLQQGLVKSPDAADYARWAAMSDMTPGALKVALHRLRGRFRKAVEEQVRETVASEADFEDEMRHLRRVLREGFPGT